MTDQSFNIPDLTDDENGLVSMLAKQLSDRAKRNQMRSDLYDGKQAIRQVGSVIPPQYYRMGLALGWAAKGVDGLGRRCNLDGMVWADGSLDELGFPQLADENFLYSELSQARTDSLIHGVSYLITTQGAEDEPRALVHAKDALRATGEWNARTRRMDNLLSVTSWKDNRITGFVLYLDGETVSADFEGGKWEVDRSEHSWGVPVDPLIYRPRASKRMGRSRITRAAMSHQKAALRALVRLEGHMDIYSIPQLWLLGASDRIFKNADGSQKAAWQVALGRIFGVPDADPEDVPQGNNGRADIKQVDASSPEPHLAQLNALAKLEAREFDLPDSDFALTDMVNPTSADSYNASRENLIAEAEGAMDDWSVSIRRTVARALAIRNGEPEVPAAFGSIKTDWRSPVYLSRAAQADAGTKQLGAVPWLAETTVGLKLLGLSQDQIDMAMSEKRRAQALQLAGSIGAAAARSATNSTGSTDVAGGR